MYVVAFGEGRIADKIGLLKSKLNLNIRSGKVMCHRKVAGKHVPAHVATAVGVRSLAALPIEAYQEPPYTEVLIVSRDGHRHRWVRCRSSDPVTNYPLGSCYAMPWWQRK